MADRVFEVAERLFRHAAIIGALRVAAVSGKRFSQKTESLFRTVRGKGVNGKPLQRGGIVPVGFQRFPIKRNGFFRTPDFLPVTGPDAVALRPGRHRDNILVPFFFGRRHGVAQQAESRRIGQFESFSILRKRKIINFSRFRNEPGGGMPLDFQLHRRQSGMTLNSQDRIAGGNGKRLAGSEMPGGHVSHRQPCFPPEGGFSGTQEEKIGLQWKRTRLQLDVGCAVESQVFIGDLSVVAGAERPDFASGQCSAAGMMQQPDPVFAMIYTETTAPQFTEEQRQLEINRLVMPDINTVHIRQIKFRDPGGVHGRMNRPGGAPGGENEFRVVIGGNLGIGPPVGWMGHIRPVAVFRLLINRIGIGTKGQFDAPSHARHQFPVGNRDGAGTVGSYFLLAADRQIRRDRMASGEIELHSDAAPGSGQPRHHGLEDRIAEQQFRFFPFVVQPDQTSPQSGKNGQFQKVVFENECGKFRLFTCLPGQFPQGIRINPFAARSGFRQQRRQKIGFSRTIIRQNQFFLMALNWMRHIFFLSVFGFSLVPGRI